MPVCYTSGMTSQAIEPSGVVRPAAIASGNHSATHALGQVLMDLVHRAGVYTSETDLHAAEAVVSAWVKSVVPLSAVAALVTGDERAPKEDVTKRVPPGGLPAIPVTTAPAIDYDRLADALLAAQRRSAQQMQAAQAKSAAEFAQAAAGQQVMGQ